MNVGFGRRSARATRGFALHGLTDGSMITGALRDLSMSGEFKYFAFISYSHVDERWSRWLHNALETYRVPARLVGQATEYGPVPARLTPVFRDRDELTGAADLSSKVTAALAGSRHLIVICSPAAARSRWVDLEIRAFKRMGRGDRILTLVVGGEPNANARPGHELEECFAASLRFEVEQDGSLSTRPAEPIAADARPGKDGRTNSKLKLIAGLLGVGFDELKQREHRRQQKRLLLITAASIAGMLLTGALAVTAWIARQDAVRSRDRAEDLIGFMLGDFRQQLESLGKLELLKNVGDKAMAYFSSLTARDITDASLLRRAQALRQIGDVRLLLGEFTPALAAFEESLTLSQALSQRTPDNQEWLFALGNAWFWVGYTHWQKGDLAAAVAPMNEYLKAAERLVSLAPEKAEWRLEQGYALANLGSLAFAMGDSDLAIRHFEASNRVAEGLIATAPADVGVLRNRIENYSWLGRIREKRGELRDSVALYARSLEFATELLALQPDDRRIQEDEVLRRKLYANVLRLTGEVAEASRITLQSLYRARALAELDPANVQWQWLLASVLQQYATLLRADRQCDAALRTIDETLQIAARISAEAADLDTGRIVGLELLSDKAACLFEHGRLDQSREVLESLLPHVQSSGEVRVDPLVYAKIHATGRYLMGRVMSAEGQPAAARRAWEAGLSLLPENITDPSQQAARALLLKALGRGREAREIESHLTRGGFAEPTFARQMRTPAPTG
jgi:tetratricopeptide (TPR) repeat protein